MDKIDNLTRENESLKNKNTMCDNDHFIIEISSLNILVSHPIYAGSHVLTLHTLRNAFCELMNL